jgi:hypothetical protein
VEVVVQLDKVIRVVLVSPEIQLDYQIPLVEVVAVLLHLVLVDFQLVDHFLEVGAALVVMVYYMI